MKIAVVAYVDLAGGMGSMRRVTMLARALHDAGNEMHLIGVICSSASTNPDELKGLHIHEGKFRGPLRGFGLAVVRRLVALRDLLRIIRAGADWIILYNIGFDGLPFAILTKLSHRSLATDNCDIRHGGDIRHLRQLLENLSYRLSYRTIRPLADLNIVVSEYLRREVSRDAPKKAIHVLPALIDTKQFRYDERSAGEFRQSLQMKERSIIAYAGSTQLFEGLHTLLQAIRILIVGGEGAGLVLAGEMVLDEFHENLPELIRFLDLEGSVLLLGRLNTSNVINLLSAADIVVLPKSNVWANIAGFPQKLVEYLAIGKPIVATRVGDVANYVQDGKNCILCEPDSPLALATALLCLIKNKQLATGLGAEGRMVAVNKFDIKVQGRILHDILNGIKAQRGF